jgi:hypothetical protein
MTEVFAEAISLVNLPFTVLLGLVVAYWGLVAFGVVTDQIGSGLGAGHDLEAGHDLHSGHDAHAGHDADSAAEGMVDGDGHLEGTLGGWLTGLIHFVNLGEVPIMGMLSILSLCLWTCSMVVNHYFTGHQAALAFAFLIPNLIVSAIATRYLTLPLRPLFRIMRRMEGDEAPMIGRMCRITTSTASPSFGQAEIETTGAPLLVDVRTMEGTALPRGANAVIFRADLERNIYYVVEASNPQLP